MFDLKSNKALCSPLGTDSVSVYDSDLLRLVFEGFNPNYNLASTISGWVGAYRLHVPNVDSYKTFPICTFSGNLVLILDSELNITFNNLDLKNEYARNLFNDIQNKIKKYKEK